MRVARVAAQAKINLWLKVGARDASGYHEIDTLFQRIDLADDVVVHADDGKSRSLVCSGPRMPSGGLGPEKKNLAYRAAEEYHAHTGWPSGFAIELIKNIPVGGGLGGGSADAGAILRALNALAPRPLDAERLHAIAASLGADVAFLATEHVSAWGIGRGDVLAAFPFTPPAAELLLAVPAFGISTADAYRWLDESRGGAVQSAGTPRDQDHRVVLQPVRSPWEAFSSGNDFEPVVEARHPQLGEFRKRLIAAGATLARLSGSGSTVFGIFDGSAPSPEALGLDALVIPSRTAARVVQVEVLE